MMSVHFVRHIILLALCFFCCARGFPCHIGIFRRHSCILSLTDATLFMKLRVGVHVEKSNKIAMETRIGAIRGVSLDQSVLPINSYPVNKLYSPISVTLAMALWLFILAIRKGQLVTFVNSTLNNWVTDMDMKVHFPTKLRAKRIRRSISASFKRFKKALCSLFPGLRFLEEFDLRSWNPCVLHEQQNLGEGFTRYRLKFSKHPNAMLATDLGQEVKRVSVGHKLR